MIKLAIRHSGLKTGLAALVLAFVLTVLATATGTIFATEIAPDERRSGYAEIGAQTRAMQDDDTSNPGMLWVLDGEALWTRSAGSDNASCATCHGDARASMQGVAARYPAFDAARGRAIDLEERINICRAERQKATPLGPESNELLALTAYVANQSRGMPIATGADARLAPVVTAGRELFNRRQGQLALSCAQCHDDNWGRRLAGNIVPQGQATGYPLYRLEWQSLGSLQRRLRNCMIGMRAEPYEYGAPENVALETFLMWRARGLPLETPAVRP
jgi:sulfur-oxidizing protein SoxA